MQRGRVGILPVKLDMTWYAERPIYDEGGRFQGFIAGWCYDGSNAKGLGPHLFCVDPGGFAFDAALLQTIQDASKRIAPSSYHGRVNAVALRRKLRGLKKSHTAGRKHASRVPGAALEAVQMRAAEMSVDRRLSCWRHCSQAASLKTCSRLLTVDMMCSYFTTA